MSERAEAWAHAHDALMNSHTRTHTHPYTTCISRPASVLLLTPPCPRNTTACRVRPGTGQLANWPKWPWPNTCGGGEPLVVGARTVFGPKRTAPPLVNPRPTRRSLLFSLPCLSRPVPAHPTHPICILSSFSHSGSFHFTTRLSRPVSVASPTTGRSSAAGLKPGRERATWPKQACACMQRCISLSMAGLGPGRERATWPKHVCACMHRCMISFISSGLSWGHSGREGATRPKQTRASDTGCTIPYVEHKYDIYNHKCVYIYTV